MSSYKYDVKCFQRLLDSYLSLQSTISFPRIHICRDAIICLSIYCLRRVVFAIFFFRYFLMDTIKLLASNPLGVAAVTDDRRLKPRQLQTIKRLHIDHQLPTPVVKI